jgi:hypothetical protein
MTLTLFDPRSGQRITFTEPAHCPTRLRANILLMLSTVALAYVIAPAAAQAQCSSSSNPPPAPAVTANFSNQSFSLNPPQKPYVVTSRGITGCIGSDGGFGESGVNGSPGQAGGQISGTNTALTIIGGAFSVGGISTVGAYIASVGGAAGAGSDLQGGNGGAGGAGSNITIRFDGTFVPDPATGLATYGLDVVSAGGAGGNGGESSYSGIWAKQGGYGGPGGGGRRIGRAHGKRLRPGGCRRRCGRVQRR